MESSRYVRTTYVEYVDAFGMCTKWTDAISHYAYDGSVIDAIRQLQHVSWCKQFMDGSYRGIIDTKTMRVVFFAKFGYVDGEFRVQPVTEEEARASVNQ